MRATWRNVERDVIERLFQTEAFGDVLELYDGRAPFSLERRARPELPVDREIILQEFSAPMFAGENAVKERITNSRGPVYDIKRRLKVMCLLLKLG